MPLKAFILLVITAIFWGSTPLVEKKALQITDPEIGIFLRSLFITMIMFGYFAVTGKWDQISSAPLKGKLLFCLSGLLAGLLGMVTYYKAIKLVPISKAVPIAASYPLVAAILGVMFLGENMTWARFVGIVFVIIGVWLVK